MIQKIPATVMILTYNSARVVEPCLRSVMAFEEILVMDGGSTDRTLEYAKAAGARIEPQSETPGPITDFTAVRDRAFQIAKYDWVFYLDSDETIDEALVEAMRGAVARQDQMMAYRVERVPLIEGVRIRHAYFMPDRCVRLVHRKTASWAKGKKVHEHLQLAEGVTVSNLSGVVLTPWATLEEYRKKDRYYLALQFSKPVERRPSFFVALRAVGKNIFYALGIVLTALFLSIRYGGSQDVLPWRYHLRFARYHVSVARERLRQFILGSRYVPPSA